MLFLICSYRHSALRDVCFAACVVHDDSPILRCKDTHNIENADKFGGKNVASMLIFEWFYTCFRWWYACFGGAFPPKKRGKVEARLGVGRNDEIQPIAYFPDNQHFVNPNVCHECHWSLRSLRILISGRCFLRHNKYYI